MEFPCHRVCIYTPIVLSSKPGGSLRWPPPSEHSHQLRTRLSPSPHPRQRFAFSCVFFFLFRQSDRHTQYFHRCLDLHFCLLPSRSCRVCSLAFWVSSENCPLTFFVQLSLAVSISSHFAEIPWTIFSIRPLSISDTTNTFSGSVFCL